MPVIHANGADIHYRIDGASHLPALVLSNSLGTDLSMWRAQADALQHRLRVIRYDTRGHGASSAPPGPYTLDQLGGDVLALLDALDIDRAHCCGLSMGGVTAQWLAIHAPGRLLKLVIANSAARVGTPDGWRQRAQLARGGGMDVIADGAAARWFTPEFIAADPERVAQLAGALRSGDAQGYAGCCDALAGADLRAEVAAIGVPTLLIAGLHDPVTTTDDAQWLCRRIAGARMVTLAASHISNIEAPAAFTAALADFLTGEGRR